MSSFILNRTWNCDTGLMQPASTLAEKAGIPPSIAAFLLKRGVGTASDVNAHFSPSLSMLHEPFIMSGMAEAVERLARAVTAGERIGIFGDYDADGVTSSALLYLFFRELGTVSHVYIPHRSDEGYGLNRRGIDWLGQQGCSVMVTVDCGVTAVKEVGYAVDRGMDVIITDHHETVGALPEALALINPGKAGCSFPFNGFAGVGVAFYLAWAVRNRLHNAGFRKNDKPVNLKAYLDLVAIGTMADVVPLTGVNRVFVRTGVDVMSGRCRPGIEAIKKVSGLDDGRMTPRDIAFRIAPMINAAGRMEHAMTAFNLLVTDRSEGAASLARYLKSLNESRQRSQVKIQKEASLMAGKMADAPACILYHCEWNQGIVGIAASKLSEKLNRPVILMSRDGDELCGSGRSPAGFNLVRLLETCSRHLLRFGGHAAAAGLALKMDRLDAFRENFMQACMEQAGDGSSVSTSLDIDADVSWNELTDPAYIEFLERLAPFGPGYGAPLFTIKDFDIISSSVVGNNHLKLRLKGCGGTGSRAVILDVMGWNQGSRLNLPWSSCELAFEPCVNVWHGRRQVQLILKDARQRS